MNDWSLEVVNHELEDRLNVLLGVSSVFGKGGILIMSAIFSN